MGTVAIGCTGTSAERRGAVTEVAGMVRLDIGLAIRTVVRWLRAERLFERIGLEVMFG